MLNNCLRYVRLTLQVLKNFIEEKLKQLEDNKFDMTIKIIKMQEEYLSIDKLFEDEMDNYRYKSRYRPKLLDYLKV